MKYTPCEHCNDDLAPVVCAARRGVTVLPELTFATQPRDPGDWPNDTDDLRKPCLMCEGTGLYAVEQDCPKCFGAGRVW